MSYSPVPHGVTKVPQSVPSGPPCSQPSAPGVTPGHGASGANHTTTQTAPPSCSLRQLFSGLAPGPSTPTCLPAVTPVSQSTLRVLQKVKKEAGRKSHSGISLRIKICHVAGSGNLEMENQEIVRVPRTVVSVSEWSQMLCLNS